MYYTYDDNLFSDLYKEVHGFRPSSDLRTEWNARTPRQKQELWNALCDEHEEVIKREKVEKARAALALTERLETMYQLGAKTEVQALKWIMEAEEFSDIDLQYGAGYFCFHFGLDYRAEKEFRIQEAINEMLALVD